MKNLAEPGANRYVGQSLERVEDYRLLNGTGTFVDDLQIPGMLHAAVLRSPVAHGRVSRLDTTEAASLDGVHAILTARDLDGPPPLIPVRIAPLEGVERFRQPVIACDKVRYVGEPLAVILATSRALAEDTLSLIELEIDERHPVAQATEAQVAAACLFEAVGTNVVTRYSASRGDAAAAFRNADYVRTETFGTQRHTAMPMELRGLLAQWDHHASRMTVWGAAKVPFFNRRHLAAMLGLEEGSVDLIEVDVGGGFGVRGEFYPEDFLIPFAARKLGRPIKWIEDRLEHMMATNHSREVACQLSIACARDGSILGLCGTVTADMGAYVGTTGGIVPSRTAQFLPGPYRIANVALEVVAVVTNKTPVGSYRGPGRFEANFFRERLFEMTARDLDMDPAEFRRRNLIAEAELPYEIGQLVPYEAATSYDCGDFHAVFEQCLTEIGWHSKQQLQGKQVDGRYHGIGLGCMIDSSGAGPKENVRLILRPHGIIRVHIGSSSLGQGIETALTQIAADALSLPMSAIELRHGSTTLLAEGFGSFHSRSIIMGGNAILDGAAKMIDKLCVTGAQRLGVAPDEVTFVDGEVRSHSGGRITLAELYAEDMQLEAEGSFDTSTKPFSFGAHAAHVAVDVETGHVELVDYVAVEDVGRMINPAIVRGQKLGSIVQGLGGVFMEELSYDEEAQLLTGTLADYLLPTATDFPRIRALPVELRRTERNPLGAKGAGEDGIAAVPASVSNAIAAALVEFDVQPTSLPLSPPRLWRLIQEAKARSAEACSSGA